MKTAAIICEYNPFHLGHEYQIGRMKALGAEYVVCIMSGNFVNRGEPALFTKWTRAKAAVLCGADLVVELPTTFAMASAERFARGGVALSALVGADVLVFGSECGDVEALSSTAEAATDPGVMDLARELMREGSAFAPAREAAVRNLYGDSVAHLLTRPNDILAVEYIKAIRELERDSTLAGTLSLNEGNELIAPRPVTIKRIGAPHDSPDMEAGHRSGSAIRATIRELGIHGAKGLVPDAAYGVFEAAYSAGEAFDMNRLTPAVPAVLRRMSTADFARLPDLSEGLENRLAASVRETSDLGGLLDTLASKRYPNARLRRLVMSAFIGMTKELCGIPIPYVRVLAAGKGGRKILSELDSPVPVVTKPATIPEISEDAGRLFEFERRATDLYALGLNPPRCCGLELTTSPYIL